VTLTSDLLAVQFLRVRQFSAAKFSLSANTLINYLLAHYLWHLSTVRPVTLTFYLKWQRKLYLSRGTRTVYTKYKLYMALHP